MEDESVTDSEPEESDSEVMQMILTMIRLKKKFFKLSRKLSTRMNKKCLRNINAPWRKIQKG